MKGELTWKMAELMLMTTTEARVTYRKVDCHPSVSTCRQNRIFGGSGSRDFNMNAAPDPGLEIMPCKNVIILTYTSLNEKREKGFLELKFFLSFSTSPEFRIKYCQQGFDFDCTIFSFYITPAEFRKMVRIQGLQKCGFGFATGGGGGEGVAR